MTSGGNLEWVLLEGVASADITDAWECCFY